METRKIALACFVGGALCCGVALLFSPTYWWLGLLAGLAGGYVGYEFREVWRAVPIAWWAARRRSRTAWDMGLALTKWWLAQPHPFVYPALVPFLPIALWLTGRLWQTWSGSGLEALVLVSLSLFLWVDVLALLVAILYGLAFLGVRRGERCFWTPFLLLGHIDTARAQAEVSFLETNGYRRKPLTYRNVLRWVALGLVVGLVVVPLQWVGELCGFLVRFVGRLFRLIHSQKRVLCALDGTLGGGLAYFWLGTAVTAWGEGMVLVIFGGLLGAALGVLNWQLVSVRLLHLPASRG